MIHIDAERCTACGACHRICPRYVPVVVEDPAARHGKRTVVSPERAGVCIHCGHCAAVCPADAIVVDGLAPGVFVPLPTTTVDPDALLGLMERRRSIRRFKPDPVPREVLDRVLEAAHRAPPATGKPCVGVIVIDRPERLKELSQHTYAVFDDLQKALVHPIARHVVRFKVGARRLDQMRSFVLPGLAWYSRWYREGKGDEVRRDAPVVMLFHAPVDVAVGDESCLIAALHAVLMAETLGVGSLVNGFFGPACNRSSALRAMLRLPGDHEVYASLCLGYPRHAFRKAIRRRLAEVRYLD
jgi:nitroreductase/NAD-dependent dihydropyrimidine dehydrogenase PreA subunit